MTARDLVGFVALVDVVVIALSAAWLVLAGSFGRLTVVTTRNGRPFSDNASLAQIWRHRRTALRTLCAATALMGACLTVIALLGP